MKRAKLLGQALPTIGRTVGQGALKRFNGWNSCLSVVISVVVKGAKLLDQAVPMEETPGQLTT